LVRAFGSTYTRKQDSSDEKQNKSQFRSRITDVMGTGISEMEPTLLFGSKSRFRLQIRNTAATG
jgi:hypothetical protein